PRLRLAGLDVLRAVAEALIDADTEPSRGDLLDGAVDAIAPARVRLQPQQPQRDTDGDVIGQRIAGQRARRDVHRALVWRRHEAGLPDEDGRPGSALRIEAADEEGRQLAEQLAVLLRHGGADEALSAGLDLLAHADTLLHRLFAIVERSELRHR